MRWIELLCGDGTIGLRDEHIHRGRVQAEFDRLGITDDLNGAVGVIVHGDGYGHRGGTADDIGPCADGRFVVGC